MLAMRKCSLQLTAARCPSTFGYSAMSARFSHRVQERRLICHHWSICHHLETFSETGIVLKLLSSNVLICNVLHQIIFDTKSPILSRHFNGQACWCWIKVVWGMSFSADQICSQWPWICLAALCPIVNRKDCAPVRAAEIGLMHAGAHLPDDPLFGEVLLHTN